MKSNSNIQIFCDFDGTITKVDVIDYLLERLADPAWLDVEQQWLKGRITSKECLKTQISLLQGTQEDILALLGEIEIDSTFGAFAEWCHASHIPLYIVSDGLDIVIKHILTREKISVDGIWSNWFIEGSSHSKPAIAFPYTNHGDDDYDQAQARQCGVCKCKVLNNYKNNNTQQIVIGDGYSDRCWSRQADMLFAKAQLSEYCQNNSIQYIAFTDFWDVISHIRHHLPAVQHQHGAV